MTRGDPAARPEWKLFAKTIGLPQPRSFVRVVPDGRIALERGPKRRIADGEARDLCGSRQIAIEQRRHYRQRIRIGVEAVRLLVRRKHERAVNLDAEKIAHRVGVLSAIETMEIRGPSRIGVGGCHSIELGLEPCGNRVVGLAVGAARPRRRHRAGAKLQHDLLPRLRRVGDLVRLNGVEHEIAGLQLRVMARNAIRRDQLTSRRRTGSGCWVLGAGVRVLGSELRVPGSRSAVAGARTLNREPRTGTQNQAPRTKNRHEQSGLHRVTDTSSAPYKVCRAPDPRRA